MTIEQLKSEGRYFHAGSLAFILGHDDNYGCHFGMRSTRDLARSQYAAGWHAAQQDAWDSSR